MTEGPPPSGNARTGHKPGQMKGVSTMTETRTIKRRGLTFEVRFNGRNLHYPYSVYYISSPGKAEHISDIRTPWDADEIITRYLSM